MQVDAVVVVKAFILDCNKSMLQIQRNLIDGDILPVCPLTYECGGFFSVCRQNGS